MKKFLFGFYLLILAAITPAFAGPQFPFAFWKTAVSACVDETFNVNSGTLTGSVIRHGMACSANGIYCMGVALEQGATASGTYHFYYSKDGGLNWTKYAYTESIPTSSAIAEDRNHGYLGTPQVIVADNGKAFTVFHNYTGALSVHVKGAYSDLSAGSPTVTQSVAFGPDAENSPGTAGYLCANSPGNRQAWLEADRTDLSFIVVACARDNDTLTFRFFTNGGATYQNSDLGGYTHHYGSRVGLTVTGSGSSHRVYAFNKAGTTNISDKLYDQPSATPVQNTVVHAGDYYIYDCDASAAKGYCLIRGNSTDEPFYYSWNIAGTPTYTTPRALSPSLDLDEYIGLDVLENSAAQAYNYGRIPGPQVVINPSDTNNVFLMTDLLHPDGIVRSLLTEIRDDTAFNGIGPSNTTEGGTQEQGFNASSQKLGQTFTATFAPFRTFSVKLNQQGNIARGNTLRCDLYATSGGVPTGAALASSLNDYEEHEISKDASYRRIFCNFNQTLTPGNVYVVVLETTHTLSTTNWIHLPSGAGYGGGNGIRWDGSTWNNTGDDLVFEVSGEWQYDINKPATEFNADTNLTTWQNDSSISKTSTSGVLSIFTKTSPVGSTAQARRQSGHTFKSQLTIGSGTTASSVGALVAAGYAPTTFQPGMVFQTQPGTTESSRKDAVTGAVSATEKAEDRSGMNAAATYTGVTYRAEAGCDSGQAIVFDASSDRVSYGSGTLNVYDVGHLGSPFSVEAQFVLDTLPSVKGFTSVIASKYTDGTANQGWIFRIDTSDKLVFQFAIGGGQTTGSTTTFVAGTVYRVKATGDGTTVRLYVHNGTTWVEEAYSAQVTTGYAASTTTDELQIGNEHNNSSPYDLRGAICYVKIQKGLGDMVATGYTSQPEMLAPVNGGKIAAMKQGIGTGSLTINTGFNQWGATVPNACYP